MLVLQDNMKNGFVRARAPVPLFKEESFRLFMSLRGFETAVEVNLQKFSSESNQNAYRQHLLTNGDPS